MTKSVTAVLNDLIQVSINGEKGFAEAADHTTEQNLKDIFRQKAHSSQRMAAELQDVLTSLDEQAEDTGTIAGAINRGWMNIRATLTGNDSYAILAECERQEDVAKAAYTNALQENLPEDVLNVVEQQQKEVVINHDQIRDLRNRYKNQNQASFSDTGNI